MRLSRRSILALVLAVVLAGLVAAAPQKKAAGKGPVKIENTDPALRLKAFADHQALKAQSPFKDVKWRFIGPFDLSGRCTDVAVPLRQPDGLLRRRGLGRHLQDRERRHDLGAHLRRPADHVHRRPGRGRVRSQHRLGRHGRGQHLPRLHGRPGRLQVDRRRQDLEAHGPRGDLHHRPRRHPSRQSRHRLRRGHRPRVDRPIPTAASTRRPTAARPGRRSSIVNERVGANDLVMDPTAPDTLYAATWNRIRRRWSDPAARRRGRPLQDDRRRQDLDAHQHRPPGHGHDRPHRHRPLPDQALDPLRLRRQPRAGGGAQARREGRLRPAAAAGHRRGRGLPLRRRRRHLAQGQPAGHGPLRRHLRLGLRPDPRRSQLARDDLHHGPGPVEVDRRRQDLPEPLQRGAPRRPPRPVDRPQRQRPPHQQQRRRRQHLLRRRQDLARLPRRHPVGPVLQRRPRQLDALLRLRLGPGPVLAPRPDPASAAGGRRAGGRADGGSTP